MSDIWLHTEQFDANWCSESPPSVCIFCQTEIVRDSEEEAQIAEEEINYGWSDNFSTRFYPDIGSCPACGWWRYEVRRYFGIGRRQVRDFWCGRLKTFSENNINAGLEETRRYLTAKYDDRFRIDPRLFEVVVGSVFADLGYKALVTAYSGDGGIDVVLSAGDGTEVGVQVKRYKNSITVEQLRALTGALVVGGYTKGIFVTTSTFQSGAEATASLSGLRGFPIELYDAKRFYDALKIAQVRTCGTSAKPWSNLPLTFYLATATSDAPKETTLHRIVTPKPGQ